jgi:hypothetical protein
MKGMTAPSHATPFSSPPGRNRSLIPGGEAQTAYNLLRHNLLTPGVLAADDHRGGVMRRELEDLLERCPGTSALVPAAVLQMLEAGGPDQHAKVMADMKATEIMVEKQANRIYELEEALLCRSSRAVDLARITTLEDAVKNVEEQGAIGYIYSRLSGRFREPLESICEHCRTSECSCLLVLTSSFECGDLGKSIGTGG